MKVILTAFGGKLQSKPMDWPEDHSGRDIYMMLDMERPSVKTNDGGSYVYEDYSKRKCRFEATRSYSGNIGEETAEIYRLVEIR